MDEIHIVNKKCTELESKLKDLNFKLAEKETIIQVLQKHSDDRDAVLQKTLRFTNARHAKSASTMGLVANGVPSGSIKNELLPNDYHQLMMANRAQQNLVIDEVVSNNPVMNFDEQLKGIDSQLSNKVSFQILNYFNLISIVLFLIRILLSMHCAVKKNDIQIITIIGGFDSKRYFATKHLAF